MRVVRLITRLNRGGPLRQLQALVPGLSSLAIDGPVWVGEPAAGEEDASSELASLGVEIVRVPSLRRGIHPLDDRRARAWIANRLREEKPDVLHTHMGKAGALGRLAGAEASVPAVVHTFHGHHLAAPFPKGRLAVLAERFLAGKTHAFVCLSPRQRTDLVETWRVIPDAKAVVIGPGIDLDAFRAAVDPTRAAEIRARHAPKGEALWLWLGRFVGVKDPAACVRAAVGARGWRVVLAGDGPLRAETEALAARLLAAASFPGPVSDPANWIAASDGVVLSSKSEGTPIAAIEAAALGKPVVSTPVGGVPDVIADGETGILAEPEALGSACARLSGDPELARRLGAAARARADARFSARRLVEETAALYRRLLSERGQGPTAR